MKFQFESDMEKGKCYECPLCEYDYHNDCGEYYCALDNSMVTLEVAPEDCPLEEVEAWHPYPEEKPKHSGFYMTKVLHSYNGTETEDTCKRYYNTHLFAFELSDSVGKVIAWRYNAQES